MITGVGKATKQDLIRQKNKCWGCQKYPLIKICDWTGWEFCIKCWIKDFKYGREHGFIQALKDIRKIHKKTPNIILINNKYMNKEKWLKQRCEVCRGYIEKNGSHTCDKVKILSEAKYKELIETEWRYEQLD